MNNRGGMSRFGGGQQQQGQFQGFGMMNQQPTGFAPLDQMAQGHDAQDFVPDQAAGFMANGAMSPGLESPTKGKVSASSLNCTELLKPKRGDTLTPCTIYQLNHEAISIGDDGFMLDGKLLGYISLYGQIMTRNDHEANISLNVDDSTGTTDVKVWVDQNDPNDFLAQQSPMWEPGLTVKIIGTLKSFGQRKTVNAYSIQPINDFNGLTLHFLDVVFVHLYNTRGPLASAAGGPTAGGATTANTKTNTDVKPVIIANDGQAQQQPQQQADGDLAGLNEVQQYAIQLVQSSEQPDVGLGIAELIANFAQYDVTEDEVRSNIAWLLEEGHLFTTIDEYHFAATGQTP